jgi:chemotaxis response regulator CheB
MRSDGAKAMKGAWIYNWVQDEASRIVFSMLREEILHGVADDSFAGNSASTSG